MNLQIESLFSLKGKKVLITGASGFLGRTMVQALLINGARVIALGRSQKLIAQANQWKKEFGQNSIQEYLVDMYNIPELEKTLDNILEKESFIEVLVNNAYELNTNTGFNSPDGTLEKASLEQWMKNLTGGIYWSALTVQKLGEAMKINQRGSIINISTMYALVSPNPHLYEDTNFINPPGYSVSKAGLLAFTRYVASFWGSYGIRSNAILPGPFSNTEDLTPNSVKQGDFFLERLKQKTCLNRIGKPQELIGALLFLASDASSYITGQALVVDGGWTIT